MNFEMKYAEELPYWKTGESSEKALQEAHQRHYKKRRKNNRRGLWHDEW